MRYFIRKEGMPMLSIGIDVSKGKSTVCGMKPGGEIVYTPFEVQHTREGMSELVSLLRGSGEDVRVVLESTAATIARWWLLCWRTEYSSLSSIRCG